MFYYLQVSVHAAAEIFRKPSSDQSNDALLSFFNELFSYYYSNTRVNFREVLFRFKKISVYLYGRLFEQRSLFEL